MKEWLRVSKPANGPAVVTCTVQDGNLTAKWSVKSFNNIRSGVEQARYGAKNALEQLREATA